MVAPGAAGMPGTGAPHLRPGGAGPMTGGGNMVAPGAAGMTGTSSEWMPSNFCDSGFINRDTDECK